MAAAAENRPDIILYSPVGSKPAVYKWPLTYVSKGQKIDGAEEIIETIRWVAREYLEFRPAIENLLQEQSDFKSYDTIKSLCDKYNKSIDLVLKMNKGTSVALRTSQRASQGLLKHIIQQVYNYAVVEPTELNKYSPFSSETYGETSFEFMAQLINRNQFKPKEQDVFIDLGSGVGHLVLQMAASVKCKKCYGIEIADVPAGYAKLMEERFKFWMNWHGKTFTEFELFHGDFFEKRFEEIIRGSNHILVNNFAFKPDVDHKLKERFQNLKDGTQILSSKPFCSIKNRVNERNLTDIGSIMHVVEVQPELKKDTVSWTPKPLPYYLHVLDGSRLERYYEKQKRRQGRTNADKGRPSKQRRIGRGGSDSLSDDSEDNTVYGPTTRKAWSEWCNASSMNASNRTSTDSGKTTSSRNNSTDTENLYDGAIEDENTAIRTTKETEVQKREKRIDTQSTSAERVTASSQENSAQNKNGQNSSQAPKSCLDKKRDYAIKKSGSSFLQNAPPSALYSISKPADATNGSSSTLKIPNIVIKVKPPIEAKVVNDTSSSSRVTTEVKKQETKVTDENGKKLRQRKRSVTNQPPPPTEAQSTTTNKNSTTTTIESKSNQANSNSILSISTNGTRAKKGQTGTRAAKTTNLPKKKATSPDKNFSLDLLHAKTVESVSGSAGYYSHPAPGCEDHSLRSIVETPSLPRVVIKDLSMFISAFLSPKNIDNFIDNTKQEFQNFSKKLQQPNAKEALLRSIEQERLRYRELHRAEEDLSKHIKFLSDRIPKAMKVHCDELGIKNTHKSLVSHLGNLLKKHQDLSAYHSQLEATLQPNQRTMNPPAAHCNSSQNSLTSPYRVSTSSATLDLSLKQTA